MNHILLHSHFVFIFVIWQGQFHPFFNKIKMLFLFCFCCTLRVGLKQFEPLLLFATSDLQFEAYIHAHYIHRLYDACLRNAISIISSIHTKKRYHFTCYLPSCHYFKANPDSHSTVYPHSPMVLYVSIIYLIGCHHWVCTSSLAMTDDITSRLPDDLTMMTVTLTTGHGQTHLWVPDDIMRHVGIQVMTDITMMMVALTVHTNVQQVP